MDASSYLQLCVGFMRDLEVVADVDQVKSHAGDLPSVIDAIFFRDPRDHHVWNVNYSNCRDGTRQMSSSVLVH